MFEKPLWQTGAVCSGSTLFASILNSSVMFGNYLQQTTFSDAFFPGALRVKFFSRQAPVLKTIFHQCVISYTCSQYNADVAVFKKGHQS